jgi:tetratricopeptide (TPR) repeat protein
VGAGVAVKVTAFAVLALIAFPRGGPIAAPVPSRVEGGPDDITAITVAAVGKWAAAVQNHVPGQRDAPLQMVAALTYDQRKALSVGMGFFLSFLHGKPEVIETPAERSLAHMAGAIRVTPGPGAFLKRAAVLHADAAIERGAAGLLPAEPAGQVSARPGAPAALLARGSLYINRDGEILGETPMEWNWPFARSLLDLVLASRPDDPFVATWYHTTAAVMLQRGLYGEAVPHLERAAAVLPDDARVLFHRACYSEILGLPRTQVLLSDQDVDASIRARSGQIGPIKVPVSGSAGRWGIPLAGDANDEAERLFRRALRADPSYVEARVRLGRLLAVRKRHDEAASELATALAANPTGSVLFYAHLFAGRSAQALGKIADSAGHYKAADLLFPGAQSSGLARSQAALLESDVPAALEAIRHVDTSTTARDPWRWYQLGAGRDADALLREMWSQVK